MNQVYLLIGGNLGDRTAYLRHARQMIQEKCGQIARFSSVYETAAWGLEDQPSFYNQALLLKTELAPAPLMETLLAIELQLGRERTIALGPRTIDIDVLLYNSEVITSDLITVPHPRMQLRRFVLMPLAEIAPNVEHPVLNQTILQLLENCPDTLAVQKITDTL